MDLGVTNAREPSRVEGDTERFGEGLGEERDPIESTRSQAARVNGHRHDDVDMAGVIRGSLDPQRSEGLHEIDARFVLEAPNRVGQWPAILEARGTLGGGGLQERRACATETQRVLGQEGVAPGTVSRCDQVDEAARDAFPHERPFAPRPREL